MNALDRAEAVVLGWAHAYTRGLPGTTRQRRIDELTSDCHEHRHWGREVGAPTVAVAASMVARTLAGMPADVLWRQHEVATARDQSPNPRGAVMGRWMKDNWWIALAVVTGAFVTTMGVGLPFEDRTTGALVGGIVIALLGLTTLAGTVVRRRRRAWGDVMIAVGTFPLYAFLWTIILPIVGLAVLIPAVLDAADARATDVAGRRTDVAEPSGSVATSTIGADGVTRVLVAVSLAAIVAAVVVGHQDVAFALVSPPLALLVARAFTRGARLVGIARVGFMGIVASLLHGVATTAMVIMADPGVATISQGPGYVATAFMGAVGVAGLVFMIVGIVQSRNRARPA